MIDLTSLLIISYICALVFCFMSLTIIVSYNPPKKLRAIIPYYLSLLFIPLVVLLAYPLAVFTAIKQVWDRYIRKDAMKLRPRREI